MNSPKEEKHFDCPSPSVSGDKPTCHILPCNVDFEGMAKTHVFFNPVQIEDGVFAGSFRGRGLLATQEEEDTDGVCQDNHPLLLSLEENQIQVKEAISNVVEWHHEHSIRSLKYKDKESSRLQAAKEWIEVSRSVRVTVFVFCGAIVFAAEDYCLKGTIKMFLP